ncbi:MAG TPA: response regulator [Chitinophagaceae bacterium]|nr:response regulator [Chitinophagaceae bacterium]
MKKFYFIFFIGFIILTVLLYFSTWWFLGGVAIIVFYAVFDFYTARLNAFDATAGELETQMELLQKQLDRSLFREDKVTKEIGQLKQAKQDLLTALNHEIRTPMNGVLGMSMLLADTTLTNEQKGYIDIIKSSGQNLLVTVNDILVNDILDYSKLDRKDKKLQNIDFDMHDTVEEVLNMFANRATKAGIELISDIDDDVPVQLSGDNKRLREVLMNLVENAVKFTQHGHVFIHVQSLSKDNNKFVLSFKIEDTGIGISAEQMKQLFYAKPARGFDNDSKRAGQGLVICRKHAELMGGKIELKSNPGSGSIFTFIVPLEHGTVSTFQGNKHPGYLKIFEGKHMLVVDDNVLTRNNIIKQLKAWKINTVAADSGIQALEILANDKNFDLVFTDLSMPQMDGLQFARTVKKSYPDLQLALLNPAGLESFKQEQELFSTILIKPLRQHVFRDTMLALFAQSEKKNKPQEMENDFSKKYPLEILIAEDNLVNQKIAIKILAKLGYQPKLANNGREALEMSGECDLILMDVQMPEMDGLEATKKIRSKAGAQPVIIAMTANVLQGDRDACLQAGMDDYTSKPINLDELLQQLEKWSLIISERKKV